MDSQANNLYETVSQPDTGNDAYTFLEFNNQGEDFDYPEFQELSQPVRSSVWPTPPSDVVADAPDRASSGNQSDASPVSATSGKGRGGGGNQAAVDALAAGMSGLNFEETGDDDSYGKGIIWNMHVDTVGCRIRLVL